MKKSLRFVVIFQFPESFFDSQAAIQEFGESLVESLPRTCEVDGFDVGSGTVNYFVLTNSPLAAFKEFRKYLGTNRVERKLRVSYRESDREQYVNLWPFRDSRPFNLTYPDGIDPFSPASKRKIPKRSPPGVSKFETLADEEWT